MNFDIQKILESKAAYRKGLADLPIGEKLRLLDAMRERAVTLRRANPSAPSSSTINEEPAEYKTSKPPRNG